MDDAGRPVVVILELPPFHACSVRFPTQLSADLAPYQAVVDPYAAAHPGFSAQPPFSRDMGDIHIEASRLSRALPGDATESLMMFDQSTIDPARRAHGEIGIERRFVHQIAPPPP